MAYQKKKMFQKALLEARRAATFCPDRPAILGCIGGCYASLGKESEAVKIIKRLKELAETRYVPSFVFAWIYMHLRDNEKTVDYLHASYAERSSYLPVIGIEPGMNFLRSDPRFENLLRSIGLPQVQDKAVRATPPRR
jgi:tetratricopeptide (TPR) repeat protein